MSLAKRWMYTAWSSGLALGAILLPSLVLGGCGGDTPPPPPPSLQWYATCGDPVCRGYNPPAGVARCTTETIGATCTTAGARCDPMDSCDSLYICASSDPKSAPGGCPISRQKYKTDIRYLDETDVQKYADELSRVKLATYRYKSGGPTRLGFILEDQEPSVCVDSEHDMVDLYGYASMAVAALKQQQKRIAVLEQEVRELTTQMKKTGCPRR